MSAIVGIIRLGLVACWEASLFLTINVAAYSPILGCLTGDRNKPRAL